MTWRIGKLGGSVTVGSAGTWRVGKISGVSALTAQPTWRVGKLSGSSSTTPVVVPTWQVARIGGATNASTVADVTMPAALTVDPVAPFTITAALNNGKVATAWNWSVSGTLASVTWTNNVATVKPGGDFMDTSFTITATVTTSSGTLTPATCAVSVRTAYAGLMTASGLKPLSYGQLIS